MSIKIHHGPPGSYKTAGAMSDDFIREAKAGRVIVTNVRGVTRERVLEQFEDLPDTFDVINVDDKTEEGRQKWAKWFHWVPKGAFLFVDEIQDIWPKRWRDNDLRALDYPGGVVVAGEHDRPYCWEQAFEKHRHWNWDMVFTTPSYKKVRDDVKQCAEMAYKHKNLAILGIKGHYIEAAHLADDDGGSPSQFLTINRKKVKPHVFRIYDSTATGTVTDTKAGFNLLQNPRVAILLGIMVILGAFLLSRPAPKVLGGAGYGDPKTASAPSAGRPAGGVSDPAKAGDLAGADSQPSGFNQDPRLEPFVDGEPHIIIALKVRDVWKYVVRHRGQDFTTAQLLDLGYAVQTQGSCGLIISKADFRRVITCAYEDAAPQASAAERSAAKALPSPSLPNPSAEKSFSMDEGRNV